MKFSVRTWVTPILIFALSGCSVAFEPIVPLGLGPISEIAHYESGWECAAKAYRIEDVKQAEEAVRFGLVWDSVPSANGHVPQPLEVFETPVSRAIALGMSIETRVYLGGLECASELDSELGVSYRELIANPGSWYSFHNKSDVFILFSIEHALVYITLVEI